MRTLVGVAAACAVLILSACGGDETLGSGDGGLSGGEGSYKVGALGSDGSFQKGELAIDEGALASGGSTAIRVDIVGGKNQLAFGTEATVGFSSACLSQGLASVNLDNPTSTTTGSVTATYTANGCAGTDVVTAVVNIDGSTLTAQGTLSVAPADLGSLEFVAATPAIIGMTGSPLPSQSTVQFRLRDSSGALLPRRTVQFSLDSTVGGTTLSPVTATSNAQGIVQTVVQAGSVHTSVRVRAQTTNPDTGATISSQSGQLVVTTGLPDQNSFSISATKLAIDGGCDGEPTTINIRAADRYNNPVPANTAIAFTTEGGKIGGQCVTGDPFGDSATESGVCSVLLVAQNPRPSNGRVTVLASALGEESFNDANGNGFYDAGEAYGDLPEAFIDFDEDGIHDSSEPILDFNGNGVHDGANGHYDGYVCAQPGVNCMSSLVDVRQSLTIVFSDTSTPLVEAQAGLSGGGLAMSARSTAALRFRIRDKNGNVLPSGTTYELASDTVDVADPVKTNGIEVQEGGVIANFSVKAPDQATVGIVSLNISLPASSCYAEKNFSFQYPVTVSSSP